uniref:Suppressor of white apricot N-terminal domain-containing protein n=1 Tax=Strigamia maritima TaxID=126957 RepID=T1IQN1_STRMM
MWHEARKQERKIRGMMVDYKKRAERRREYYEKIKADPTQFIQIHGRPTKVHLDPLIAQQAETPATMMPWQGQQDNLIDRFDVRAHLDYIPEYKSSPDALVRDEDNWEERQANYERFRTLVQNDFLLVSEEKFLYQIYLEEQFGPIGKSADEEKKKLADKKVAIAYTYEDSTPQASTANNNEDEEKKDEDSDIDLDVTINVEDLTQEQSKEMNELSFKYGMFNDDFIRLLHKDKEEAEALRLAKEAEEEKAMYSGRKSRRERRAFREKKLQGRKISPPSYAARESPTYDPYKRSFSASRSRSRSPVNSGQITYITSFGDEDSDGNENDKSGKAKGVSTTTVPCNSNSSAAIVGPVMPAHMLPAEPSTSSSHSCHSLNVTNRRSLDVIREAVAQDPRRRIHAHDIGTVEINADLAPGHGHDLGVEVEAKRKITDLVHVPLRHRVDLSPVRQRLPLQDANLIPDRHLVRGPGRILRVLDDPGARIHAQSHLQRVLDRTHDRLIRITVEMHGAVVLAVFQPTKLASHEGDSRQMTDNPPQSRDKLAWVNQVTDPKSLLTPQEKLKRKMQAALNRQYKADKKAEQKKIEKLEQERQDREEELREMAIKLRRR